MSNTVQIKRGNGVPPDGTLAPYELGYDANTNEGGGFLYIGGALVEDDLEQGTMKYGATQGIKVSFATDATNATNTTYLKNEKASIDENGYIKGTWLQSTETTALSSLNDSCNIAFFDKDNWLYKFRTLPLSHGGTGSTTGLLNAPNNAIIIKNQKTSALAFIGTANGAFYATSADGSPSFGTLPIAQGGTGATTAAQARTNLGAAAASHTHNYLPLSGGKITTSGAMSNGDTKWGITIYTPPGDSTATNYSGGIMLQVGTSQDGTKPRYAGIYAYANLAWGNQVGLRFATTNNAGGGDVKYASFVDGTFTAPVFSGTFVTTNYGTSAPSGTTSAGTIYFKVVS